MKKTAILAVALAMLAGCISGPEEAKPDWSEEFNSNEIDWTVWSKIPRGTPHWQIHMSDYDGCFEMRDTCLVLKGIVNPGVEGDDSPILTGGLWTHGKKSFGYGRLEIRARIGEAAGAWPALWMMPQDGESYIENEYGGEIDICEKLNFDSIAYQTLHTRYTLNDTTGHVHGATGDIVRNEYNIYAVEHYRDSIKLFVNDVCTLNYKRQPELGPLQWSFDKQFALYIDMQVGAPWPGEAKLEDLPVEMAIDWIRFYEYPDEQGPGSRRGISFPGGLGKRITGLLQLQRNKNLHQIDGYASK